MSKKNGTDDLGVNESHVEEDLQTSIKALICDLYPEIIQFFLVYPLHVLLPSPNQCIEHSLCEFLSLHHTCH